MFLNKVIDKNPKLIECGFMLHEKGEILPDTYILDLDAIINNGKAMVEKASEYGIELYFMLKQIGRNPLIAKALMDIGFKGAVCVDYKEALTMINNGIHICNVGHLVQIPDHVLKKIIEARVDYITVYSYEKIEKINEEASKLGIKQKLLIRLSDEDSELYSGQEAGFNSKQLSKLIEKVRRLDHVVIGGLTVFPALLYSETEKKIVPTKNILALKRGMDIANKEGLKDLNINVPSATCVSSIPLIHELGGTSGEPGHGLTGTTPLHKYSDQIEIPAYIYVSEIAHHYNEDSYCYGGGHYRRSHMENVLVGHSLNDSRLAKVIAPSEESIDYHYQIKGDFRIGDCAIMAYRTQIFTTRSHVAVVKGISQSKPEIVGLYNALGEKIERNW